MNARAPFPQPHRLNRALAAFHEGVGAGFRPQIQGRQQMASDKNSAGLPQSAGLPESAGTLAFESLGLRDAKVALA